MALALALALVLVLVRMFSSSSPMVEMPQVKGPGVTDPIRLSQQWAKYKLVVEGPSQDIIECPRTLWT
jgi:hypothetical protein